MRIAILGPALALAACNQGAEPTDKPVNEVLAPEASATQVARLEELSETDIIGAALEGPDVPEAELEGELACSFRSMESEGMLFLGRGNVDQEAGATGVVKYAGEMVRLKMAGTGGYDAMADGARFEGEGLALTIATTGIEPIAEEPQVAMESPIYPATLTLTVTGEEESAIQGLFECGP